MKFKRLVSSILAFALLMTMLIIPVNVSASVQGDFTYYVSDGKAVVTGYTGGSSRVSIPSTLGGYKVTEIGAEAFSYSDITSVTIPSTVTVIGRYAFHECEYLTSITIPSKVTTICEAAFSRCLGLTSITIPSSVTRIEPYAFDDCSGLTSVTIPSSVTSIDDHIFSGCNKLKSVKIPSTVKTIGIGAFYYCESLTGISVPSSVTSIGESAFAYCKKLSSVTIPDSVVRIGKEAFEGTAWYDNKSDGEIYINKVLYSFKGNMGDNYSLKIKSGTVSITENAFEYCSSLSSVTAPDSLMHIGNNGFRNSKWYKEQPDGPVYIGKVLLSYKSDKQPDTHVEIKDGTVSIADYAFYYCDNISSVTIPDSVKSIGVYSFSTCNELTSLNFGNGVETIDEYAFCECPKLTSISIPNGVKSIDSFVFSSCSSLQTVNIPDSVTSIDVSAFYRCPNLTDVNVSGGSTSFKSIDGVIYTKDGKTLVFCPDGKKSVAIPEGVAKIGDQAFSENSNITEIKIPDSVTEIGVLAFGSCTRLASISIPDGVKIIREDAFSNCTSLSSVIIPDSVVSLGGFAFYECSNLRSIVLSNNLDKISRNTFDDCRNLSSVAIPDGVAIIDSSAFTGCHNLSSIPIPDSVKSIKCEAFGYSGLRSVYYFGTLQNWQKININNDAGLNYVNIILMSKNSSDIQAIGADFEDKSIKLIVSDIPFSSVTISDTEAMKKYDFTDPIILNMSMEKNGQAIKPEQSPVYLYLPLPEGMDKNTFKIFRIESNGSLTDMNAVYSYGGMLITASELGNFAIVQQASGEALLGDMNGDGSVTSEDALICLKAAIGMIEIDSVQAKVADVNGDNQINSEDALNILKYSVGLIDKFPAEK